MRKTARRIATICLTGASLLAVPLAAQEASSAPPPRPPEGETIIDLPSSDVSRAGTLNLLFTHRFSQPLEHSDIHSLYSFDSGADIGIGLSYVPVKGLEAGFYRSSDLDVYEAFLKSHVWSNDRFAVAARAGADWRTDVGAIFDADPGYSRRGYFGQAVLAASLPRVRVTLVPTYVSETSLQPFTTPRVSYKSIFQVPAAVSIAVTRTVNVQSEIYPRLSRIDSAGVGWIASIEKTVPRHRFAFTVGNVRTTTVDQYVAAVPFGVNPRDYYIGFNLVRQWNLK